MGGTAVLLGTGYAGEDVLRKLPWARHLETHVLSRVGPAHHEVDLPVRGLDASTVRSACKALMSTAQSHAFAYDDPLLSKQFDADDLRELEAWLGQPLRFIATMDRRFYDRRRQIDSRDVTEAVQTTAAWVSWFRQEFTRCKPDALQTTLEDDVFSLAALYVARRMGIRTVATLVGRFPGRGLMLVEEFQTVLGTGEGRSIDELRALYAPSNVSGEALQRTRGYWDLGALPARIKDAAFMQTYQAFRRQALAVHPREAHIIPDANLLVEAVKHVTKSTRKLRAGRLASALPEGARYVFFPLHYEDDAQITFRDPMLDQAGLLENLARSLPNDVWLAIKPHPHYFGTDQRIADLRRLARLERVVILNPSLPPSPLVQACEAVVTINSTAGFEALIQGKPVITLGNDFYCHEPPCTVVRRLDDLPGALVDVVQGGGGPTAADRERFVRRTDACTIPIEGTDLGYGVHGFTDADGEAIAQAWRERVSSTNAS